MSEPALQHRATDLGESPDLTGAYPRLDDGQLRQLRARGNEQQTSAGEVLYHSGDQPESLYVVLAGTIGEIDGDGPAARLLAVHGPRRLLGELNLLTGRPVFVGAQVLLPGRVLRVPLPALRELASSDSAFADLLLRSYLLRRPLQLRLGAGLRIIGSRYSTRAREMREFVARNRIPHRWIDLEQDRFAEQLLRELGVANEVTPLVIWEGKVLRNPSPTELAEMLGLRPAGPLTHDADLVVVGAGPAGLAAAVYAASEGLNTIVLDAMATGGQAGTSPRIENYLGFPSGISGEELAERAALQAAKFGACIVVPAKVTDLEQHPGCYTVRVDGTEDVKARAVVLAMGVHYRRLSVPGMQELEASSVYYAATEVEANLCRGDPVTVVGGGNSAGQAALFLARTAASVTLLVRNSRLEDDMSRYLADRLSADDRIQVSLNAVVRQLLGDERLEGCVVEDTATGESTQVPCRAMFVFIGASPQSEWLNGRIALDESGFVLTGANVVHGVGGDHGPGEGSRRTGSWAGRDETQHEFLETSWPGVFAIGDIRSGSVKRVSAAVGEGAMSVLFVHQHLAATGAR